MNPAFKKKLMYQILTAVCICVFLASVIYLSLYSYRYFTHRKMSQNIATLYENTFSIVPDDLDNDLAYNVDSSDVRSLDISMLPESANEKEYSTRILLEYTETEGRKRFSDFLSINNDFQGMLIIDSLDIKLPYVQYSDNEKYLNTDFEGNSSNYGTVFLSNSNNRLLTDKNSVFFGHHLRNGAMFAPLLKYRKIRTVSAAPVITLDSLTGKTEWLVFAAYVCEPDFEYINTQVDGLDFANLLDEISSRSLFTTNVDVTEDDQIITLSTCAYDFQDARFAVHARKLRYGEKMPEITVYENPNYKRVQTGG